MSTKNEKLKKVLDAVIPWLNDIESYHEFATLSVPDNEFNYVRSINGGFRLKTSDKYIDDIIVRVFANNICIITTIHDNDNKCVGYKARYTDISLYRMNEFKIVAELMYKLQKTFNYLEMRGK